jgi:hypothetical protein
MSGKPKTIPSASRNRQSSRESQQALPPSDQNRAQKCVESGKAGISAPVTAKSTFASSNSDSPTDENFVNDDIIEENSHVIPPVRKSGSGNAGKHGKKGQHAR